MHDRNTRPTSCISLLIAALVGTFFIIVSLVTSNSNSKPPANPWERLHALFVHTFSWALLLFTGMLYICVITKLLEEMSKPKTFSAFYDRGRLRLTADQRRHQLQVKRASHRLENH